MGSGEQLMTQWGYIASGFAIGLAFLSFVTALLIIVILKSSVSITLRNNTVILAAITIAASILTALMGALALWKIFKANQLYLTVASKAATGELALVGNQHVQTSSTSRSQPQEDHNIDSLFI